MHTGFNSPMYVGVGGVMLIVLGLSVGDSRGWFAGAVCLLVAAFHHGQNTAPPK